MMDVTALYLKTLKNTQEMNIFERISTLFALEDVYLSVGSRILCKTFHRRIEKFEATVKEVANLN